LVIGGHTRSSLPPGSRRAKLLENGAFAKEYLLLLVREFRVNKREVQTTGGYAALAQAVAGNPDDVIGVPKFAPKWLPDQGSNLGPAD
jgi:site-specific DNA recombinase